MDVRELTDDDLQKMRDDLDREAQSRREQDAPRSYGERNGHGRRVRPTEIQGVLFQVRVPVGRRGETMPAFVLFPPVRDERDLEELAEQVEREFRTATVYQPRDRDRDRHGYRDERDRNYRRDWR